MIVTPSQRLVLDEMGIPLWEARSSKVEQTTTVEYTSSELSQDLPAQACWFFMQTTALNDSEKRLLTAILKAINIDWQSVALLEFEQIGLLEKFESQGRSALIFAEQSAIFNIDGLSFNNGFVHSAGNAQVAITHSLAELLAKPALKQHVWQRLQALRHYLQ